MLSKLTVLKQMRIFYTIWSTDKLYNSLNPITLAREAFLVS